MEKFKLGFAPTRRFLFSKEDAYKYKELIKEKMKSFHLGIEIVDLEGINEEGLLYNRAEEQMIIDRFISEKVDAVFFPHCNFGTEDLVAKIAKAVGKPV